MNKDNKTELQKKFEEQTPTIKGVKPIEYLQTFVTWLHFQIEKPRGIDWLIKNKESLSVRGIERQLKMPDSTLIKAVNGSQSLPKKWTKPLNKFINNLVKL